MRLHDSLSEQMESLLLPPAHIFSLCLLPCPSEVSIIRMTFFFIFFFIPAWLCLRSPELGQQLLKELPALLLPTPVFLLSSTISFSEFCSYAHETPFSTPQL